MVQVWKTGEGPDFTCPYCGASYSVQIRRYPTKEKDSAECSVCHQTMAEWNSTESRTYTLRK